MSKRYSNKNRVVSTSTDNLDKTFGKHHVAALVGWEAERERFAITRVGKIDFSYLGATESIFGANFDDGYSYTRDQGLLSLVIIASYDFDSKYYITGTFIRDGSSMLRPDTRWGNVWSASGS